MESSVLTLEDLVSDVKPEIAFHLDEPTRLCLALTSQSFFSALRKYTKKLRGIRYAESCCRRGDMKLLQWASDLGFPISERCAFLAAREGSREILTFLMHHPRRASFSGVFEPESPLDENSPSFAAMTNGNIGLVEWLKEIGSVYYSAFSAIIGAVYYGHYEYADELIGSLEFKMPQLPIVEAAIMSGNMEAALCYLSPHPNLCRRPTIEDLVSISGATRNVEILEYFSKKGLFDEERIESALHLAVSFNYKDNVKWLLNFAQSSDIDVDLVYLTCAALRKGHCQLVSDFISSRQLTMSKENLKNLAEAFVDFASDHLSQGGEVEALTNIFEELKKNEVKLVFDEDEMIRIVRLCDLEFLEEVIKFGQPSLELTSYVMQAAVEVVSIPMITALLQRNCPFDSYAYEATIGYRRPTEENVSRIKSVFSFLISQGYAPTNSNAVEMAIMNDYPLSMLSALIELGFPLTSRLYSIAAAFGSIPVMDLLFESGVPLDPSIIQTKSAAVQEWVKAHS